jgi:pectin methylesterase-like acyl-CoA thioesterase
MSQLQAQLQNINQERSKLHSQLSELQNQFSSVTQESALLNSQLSQLQTQLETVTQERGQLRSQMSQLQSQFSSVTQERTPSLPQPSEQSQLVKKSQPNSKVPRREGLIVSQRGQGDYSTISEAIQSAKPGTRIFVRPGLYNESLIIDKQLEIIGDGALEDIIIESEDSNCLLMQTDYALVRGLTFSEIGRHYTVNIPQGQLVIEDSDLTANSNYSVVAIGGSTANPIIRRCQIHDGKWNGIWVSNNARGLVEDCEIFDNGSSGVGIGQGANLVIRQCQINWNEGNAIKVYNKGSVTVEECDLTENTGGAWNIAQGGYVRSSGNTDGETSETSAPS